jgi:hypothetical protein
MVSYGQGWVWKQIWIPHLNILQALVTIIIIVLQPAFILAAVGILYSS